MNYNEFLYKIIHMNNSTLIGYIQIVPLLNFITCKTQTLWALSTVPIETTFRRLSPFSGKTYSVGPSR
jgi:hypothetical protein